MKSVYEKITALLVGIPMYFGESLSFYKPFNSFSEVYSLPVMLREWFYTDAIAKSKEISEQIAEAHKKSAKSS